MTEERWQKVALAVVMIALNLRVGFLDTLLIALLMVVLLWIWDPVGT